MRRTLILCSCAAALCLRAADFLPTPPVWSGASEALIAGADNPWITPAERSGFKETPSYAETVAFLQKLATASETVSIRIEEFGRSAQGRALHVVVATRKGKTTRETLSASGHPTLLVQAGIHSGEIDGKDAGMMLLRDIAFRGKESLLDHANLLFVPMFNPDGHERSSAWNRPNQRGPARQGWRTTAQNLNLNRDYMKADSPEMQAMLKLISEWSPSLYLDVHVTDGMDYQYDITFGYHGDRGTTAWSPKIGGWLNETYRPAIERALTAAGHIPGCLVFERDDTDPSKGLTYGSVLPRFSQGYGDMRHLPTVLIENHSLKPFRQRVLGTYVLIEASLRVLAARSKELRESIASDESNRPASLPMNWVRDAMTKTTRRFLGFAHETISSPATGATEIRWLPVPKVYEALPVWLNQAETRLKRPKAYYVPVTKPDVIARLKLHGIRIEPLASEQTIEVDMYRLVEPRARTNSGFHPFEGRYTLQTGVKVERRREAFPAGSVRVSSDQPLGSLAMALLEPESHDSFFAWGFFTEILQQTEYIEGYVLAPLAERMLADNPELKEQFEAKLAAEPAFAKNPRARMRWFYERSPYHDDRHLLYPVGVER